MTLTACLLIANFASFDSTLANSLVPLRSAAPIESVADFRPLGKIIGDAQVVGAGEATHGSKEIFQLKHRLFQYLVREKGFTVLALEANMPNCMALDRYVLTGEGDAVSALKEQEFWTWTTQEVLEMVKWMRAYNLDPKNARKLRIVGVDMQNRHGVLNGIAQIGKRIGDNEAYANDPLWFASLRYQLGEDVATAKFNHMIGRLSNKVDAAGNSDLASFLLGLRMNFAQASQLEDDAVFADDFIDVRGEGVQAFPIFRANVEVLKTICKGDSGLQYVLDTLLVGVQTGFDEARFTKGLGVLTSLSEKENPNKGALEAMTKVANLVFQGLALAEIQKHSRRDQYMAKNVEWIVREYLPGQKAMLWAHNWHVMARASTDPETCGGELRKRMPGKYFSIGFAFGSGGFRAKDAANRGSYMPIEFSVGTEGRGTLDDLLAGEKPPLYFVETRRKAALSKPFTTRNVGAQFDTSKPASYVGPVNPSAAYDGLIFIDKVLPAVALK